MRLKKGDYVARKSYGKDIFFIIDRIIKLKNGNSYAVLKGVTIRIEADAPLDDIDFLFFCNLLIKYNLKVNLLLF